MKFVHLILGVVGSASLTIACGTADPTSSTESILPQAATAASPDEESAAPLLTCNPQTEHLCRAAGCRAAYCEANGVDCAVCHIVRNICECE